MTPAQTELATPAREIEETQALRSPKIAQESGGLAIVSVMEGSYSYTQEDVSRVLARMATTAFHYDAGHVARVRSQPKDTLDLFS